MNEYRDWKDNTPHTDTKAKITKLRNVIKKRVIEVKGALYRNAIISGVFELENQSLRKEDIKYLPSGKQRVKVICAWHGVTPPTTYPQLTINDASIKIIENFTGTVADNIS